MNIADFGVSDKALKSWLRKKKCSEISGLLVSDPLPHFQTQAEKAILDLDHADPFYPFPADYKSPLDPFWYVSELSFLFSLIPAHAKAFGFRFMTQENVREVVCRLNAFRRHLILESDFETAKKQVLDSDLKILKKCFFALDLLKVSPSVVQFVGLSENELLRFTAKSIEQRKVIRGSVDVLSDADITRYLKAVSPERKLLALKKRQRSLSAFLSQVLELVGEHKGKAAKKYASAVETESYKHRRFEADKWALGRQMHDRNTDELVEMATLVESRRKAQLAQMYAVCKGMQGIADLLGWDYAMLTLTLPGEWHSARSGKASGRSSEWNMRTPEEAARHLQAHWNSIATRIKQLLGKDGGLGFAMREPHEDGTVHLHCSVMAPKAKLIEIRRYCIAQCEAAGENVEEEIADEFLTTQGKRLHFLAWKPVEQMDGKKASSPASYMFKYLSKGMLSEDVAAWKTSISIRQVSWINFGRGFVTKWQTFYRYARALKDGEKAADIDQFPTDPALVAVVEDMSNRNWTAVVGALTGLLDGPQLHAVKQAKETRYKETVEHTVAYTTDGDIDGGTVWKKDQSRDWNLVKKRKLENPEIAYCWTGRLFNQHIDNQPINILTSTT